MGLDQAKLQAACDAVEALAERVDAMLPALAERKSKDRWVGPTDEKSIERILNRRGAVPRGDADPDAKAAGMQAPKGGFKEDTLKKRLSQVNYNLKQGGNDAWMKEHKEEKAAIEAKLKALRTSRRPGFRADDQFIDRVVDAANSSWGYNKADAQQLSKIKAKAAVGSCSINWMVDNTNISYGLANHINAALKEHRASNNTTSREGKGERLARQLREQTSRR